MLPPASPYTKLLRGEASRVIVDVVVCVCEAEEQQVFFQNVLGLSNMTVSI
jgi:hypothetical protein